MGGPRLRAQGLTGVVASESLSVVGFSEVVEKIPALSRALSALRSRAIEERPDGAILIDFPDFHGLLSARLERLGIPILYYVSPQVWAWRRGRARTIARRARRIITLFPFEVEIYRRYGGDVVWAGHPLVDEVREGLEKPSPLPPKTRRRLVLLPGSRAAEVRRHWLPMSQAAVRLSGRHDIEIAAVRAAGLSEDLFSGAAASGIRVVTSGMHALLATADLAFVASGTATLEAALCATPMVVVYRTSRASFAVGKLLVRVPWISLVNIVAGAEVVPELLQGAVNAQRLEQEGEALLASPSRVREMREGLKRVAERLGPPGGSERAADAVLEALGFSSGGS
jgi:lipid-A-disaccharide synthase